MLCNLAGMWYTIWVLSNRIAELDRQGVKWRKMKEINVVDINYKKTTYENWTPVPSGLNSTVKLVEVK